MRITLVALPLVALAACAPGDGSEEKGRNSPLPGLELAVAEDRSGEVAEARVIDLSVEEVELAMEYEDIRLIDVRRPDEVAEGMIPGAEHIAMDDFDAAEVVAGDDRPIILYCRSGRRSRIVGEQLAAHTGKSAIHLEGGILAWLEAGRPVKTD